MNDLQRQIIEALILKPRTAQQLAWDMDWDRQEVINALDALALSNSVGAKFNVAPGDAVCGVCGEMYEDVEVGETCPRQVAWGERDCGGYLVDVCLWVYCGGPISKALEAA